MTRRRSSPKTARKIALTNDLKRKVKRCAICREPGHDQSAHTPMERQRYRLTGKVERPPTTGARACSDCQTPPYGKHQPWCRRFE